MLRRDIAQLGRDLGQLRGGAQPAVDVRATPSLRPPAGAGAGRLHHPPDNEFTLVRDPRRVELRRGVRIRCDLEERLDLRLAGPGAHHIGPGPAPEDEPQRVDEHRLAGARLACDHAETRAKLEDEALDEHEISDGQLNEHGRRS